VSVRQRTWVRWSAVCLTCLAAAGDAAYSIKRRCSVASFASSRQQQPPASAQAYTDRVEAGLRAALAGLQDAVAADMARIGRHDLHFLSDAAERLPPRLGAGTDLDSQVSPP